MKSSRYPSASTSQTHGPPDMVDLNQALTSQFQPQNDFTLEELLLLLQGGGGQGQRVSATGFAQQPPTATAPAQIPQQTTPGEISLTDRLASMFGGPEALDRAQKAGSLLSLFGPAGSAINFGVGQLARTAANEAFAGQTPIGFLEDIRRPDLFFGSPLDIQRERETGRIAANVAAAPQSQGLRQQRSAAQDRADAAVARAVSRAQPLATRRATVVDREDRIDRTGGRFGPGGKGR